MNSAVLIGWSYFTALPVQRWLNAIGALLMIPGAVMVLMGHEPSALASWAAPTGVVTGALLIILTPLLAGGGVLRYASTRSLLHLRPRGRIGMLLGGTLAMTVIALLILAALLLVRELTPSRSLGTTPLTLPTFHLFAMAWSVVALLWLPIFVLCRWPPVAAMVWLPATMLPLLAPRLGGWQPTPLGAFGFAVIAWLLFCAWYLRTPRIVRLPLSPSGRLLPLQKNGPDSPEKELVLSTSRVIRKYLVGAMSPFAYTLAPVGGVLAFELLRAVAPRDGKPVITGLVMPIVATMCATIGYMLVPRARALWLRLGTDRASLFRLAERQGLLTAGAMMLAAAAAVALSRLAHGEGLPATLLPQLAAQLALALPIFYLGLSMTGRSTLEQGLNVIGALLLFVALMALTVPSGVRSMDGMLGMAVAGMAVAFGLRAFALHRWRRLDWRVAKLPGRWERVGA